MNILVTGGAGFIGHHLVAALLARGDRVTVLDDLSTGTTERLAPFMDRIRFIDGSILDRNALDAAVEGSEVILHHAALASVEHSIADPRQTNDVNVTGTIEVVLAAAQQGVRRIVFAASSSAYGDSRELPSRESQPPSPLSPYAASKVAGEYYLHALGELHGIATVALRYFNVFGPGQDPKSEYAAVVPRFTTAMLDGRRPTVNGDGSVSRDFTYIDNVVEANLLAADDAAPERLTCNIGCGSRATLLDLLAALGRATGRDPDPVFGPPRPGDVPHSQADISIATERLGYRVSVPFEEGIARTVAWYRDQAGDAPG